MSFVPNLEAARKRFIERVANAYELTWHGYGYVGPDYTYAKAVELATAQANAAFPLPSRNYANGGLFVDDSCRDLVDRLRGYQGSRLFRENYMQQPSQTDWDDGVVGDGDE
jgi:hypothetical protein